MTSNLPAERQDSTPALLGGQAALFENPAQLLDLSDVDLKELAVLFGRHGSSVFAQVRAQAGLLAWAGWFRFGEVTYATFLLGLARDLGVQPDTLMKWRRDVVKERKLAVPGVVKARSDAAKEGHKAAGQTAGAGWSSGKSKPIPATSKETPAKKSEGVSPDPAQAGELRGPTITPSDPPSGGAELQAPAGPTDEPPPSSRSAPPDPSDPEEIIERDFGGTVLRGPRKYIDECKLITFPDPSDNGRIPSDRQLAARVLTAMHDIEPDDAGPVLTPEDATMVKGWASRAVKAWQRSLGIENEPVEVSSRTDRPMPTRSPGHVIRPKDRKAKAEAAAPVDPANCRHPKDRESKLPYAIMCGVCGSKLR